MKALLASLALLFAEQIDGPSPDAAYMLNGSDSGLLRSLDGLSAAAASSTSAFGGASIAAHVDHVRYGLELMNRWSDGEVDHQADRPIDPRTKGNLIQLQTGASRCVLRTHRDGL